MKPEFKSILSKILAFCGTIVLWAPIAFMFVTAVIASIAEKQLLFDYLMLAEEYFFEIVLGGLVLLLVASILSKRFIKWFAWGTAAALVSLAAGQILAAVSGLSSGTLSQSNTVLIVVIASIAVYNLVIVALAVLGIVLVRRLFRKNHDELIPAA